MERRKEPRVETNQEVTVTVLGEADAAPFKAESIEMSGSGMSIFCSRAVPYQAAVKVQAGDLLLLGEVIRVQAADGGHMVALKLQHSLDLAGDLRRLHQALQEDLKVEQVTMTTRTEAAGRHRDGFVRGGMK